MCLATAVLEKEDQSEEVMRDVAWIETTKQGVRLMTFMGDERLFQAAIKHVDLIKGVVVLEANSSE